VSVPPPISADPQSEHAAPGANRPATTEVDASKPAMAIRGVSTMFGDLAALGSGRLTGAFLSLATVLLATRLLGPVGYGVVALVGIVSMLVFSVSTAWTGVAVRRYGREDLELRGLISRLTWNRLVIGAPLVAVSVSLVISLKVVGALPATFTWPLVWLAIAIAIATMLSDHWICLLETGGRMKISAASQVLGQLVNVGGLLAIVLLGRHASPSLVLMLSLTGTLVMVIGAAPFVWRLGLVPPSIDRELLRRMLWLSAPTLVLMVSQYVFASIDLIALRVFSTQANVGIYAVAYRAYSVLTALAVAATGVLVPLFVSLRLGGRGDLVTRYLVRGVPQGVFVISAVAGVLVPSVPLLVPLLFGPSFGSAADPLCILVVGAAVLCSACLIAPILTLHEQTRATAVINLIAAAINVIGDLILIGVLHVLGVSAPALATTAALFFTLCAFHVRARTLEATDVRLDPALALPLIAGCVPALAFGAVLGAATGVFASLAASMVIVLTRSPIAPDDYELLSRLEMPSVVRRALRAAAFAGR
jgi:O-antigen/teichoic acid export membrane protein